jgi:4-hydroxybenzoate polyprenyltransferase
VAQGFLSYFEGLGWTICWSAVAVTGAYLLNPVCVLFFVAGCILEAVYCRMLKISPLRSAVNGIVKTLGALAAVFAVDPRPSFLYLFTLFVTLFLWEIGGQNVPNDCSDVEEDRKLEARTVPVSFGLDFSAYTSGVTLIGAFLLSFVLLSLSGASFPWPYYMGLLFFGVNLLLIPAYRFSRSPDCSHAMILFNKASLYPAALFAVVLTGILFR